jgi:hypothetical protein
VRWVRALLFPPFRRHRFAGLNQQSTMKTSSLSFSLLCLLFPTAIMILGSGCASIVHGTTQEISISSYPVKADVDIDGTEKRTTPCKVSLKRKMDHLLTFTMEGYYPQTVSIKHTVSGAVAGNILAGGLIGWGVDASSGAQYKLEPESVSVTLNPKEPMQKFEGSTTPGKPTLTQRLEEIDKLKSDGKISDEEYQKLRQKIISDESLAANPSASSAATNAPINPVVNSTNQATNAAVIPINEATNSVVIPGSEHQTSNSP